MFNWYLYIGKCLNTMANKNNAKYDYLFTDDEKEIIKHDYMNGLSIREVAKKYNIKSKHWIEYKLLDGVTRNSSEATKIAYKKYPEKFKQNEISKSKIRTARLKFLKEHPEQTAWRTSKHNISYPEKCFIKYLKDRGIDKRYEIEREKSFFPYFADFAFNEIKLVVEIDGSQHILEKERKERDIKKDNLIQSLGWKIIRYTEDVVKHDWGMIDRTLLLDDFDKINTGVRYGIFKKQSGYVKKERLSNGLTQAQIDSRIKRRKVEWPSKEELFSLIKTTSFVELGKRFGVCDKTVVKWCKNYGLPYKRKDLRCTF